MNHVAMPRGVSVIIPTINRAVVLCDTVKDLLCQNFDRYEIIVVDQSSDINVEVLGLLRAGSVPSRYFKADFRGLPQARNFGWSKARYEIVLYIDDDIRTNDNLVRAHYNAHARTGAAMVAGGIDEARGDSPSAADPGSFDWWTATATRNFSIQRPGWCLHAPGGNFSIRRSVLEAQKGIDEIFSVGASLYEESELALRLSKAGYKSWFEPEARLTHLAVPMGGCRVEQDWPRYMYGLAHNRTIIIYRHLRPWHRPTALLRLLLLGLSYCRLDSSFSPMKSTLLGFLDGKRAAVKAPLTAPLEASECTIS